jgi:chromate transporter
MRSVLRDARRLPANSPTPLGELARLFAKLGATAFGGPAAHIAMMEDEVVRRRGWLTREQFLDYLGATNLIPGPNSTELAIHIGHARGGWPGLFVAGAAFILPAAVIVTAAAWAYVTYGSLPQVEGLLYGVKPVVMAVVAQALWGLGRSAVKSGVLAIIGMAAIVAAASGVHELVVLAATGAGTAIVQLASRSGRETATRVLTGLVSAGATLTAAQGAALHLTATPVSLSSLFLVFAKAGSVLFGSGYVLLAFLRADLVERLGWLTEPQLLDAVAIGQVTPGPVFTTATFIGYVLAGPAGAIVATVGIFLPAFVFVALSGPLVPRLRRSPVAGAVLDGVNVASLALMAVVSWQLGAAALVDPLTVCLALASLAALVYWRINSAWLIGVGAVVGWIAGWGVAGS